VIEQRRAETDEVMLSLVRLSIAKTTHAKNESRSDDLLESLDVTQ
jgi:hypothetical protein